MLGLLPAQAENTPDLLRIDTTAPGHVKFIGLSSAPFVGTVSVVAPANSTLKNLQDLKDKKVAFLPGTIRHSVLVKSLQSVGLAMKDIDSLVESDITIAKLLNKGIPLLITANGDFAKKHPSTLKVLRRSCLRPTMSCLRRCAQLCFWLRLSACLKTHLNASRHLTKPKTTYILLKVNLR